MTVPSAIAAREYTADAGAQSAPEIVEAFDRLYRNSELKSKVVIPGREIRLADYEPLLKLMAEKIKAGDPDLSRKELAQFAYLLRETKNTPLLEGPDTWMPTLIAWLAPHTLPTQPAPIIDSAPAAEHTADDVETVEVVEDAPSTAIETVEAESISVDEPLADADVPVLEDAGESAAEEHPADGDPLVVDVAIEDVPAIETVEVEDVEGELSSEELADEPSVEVEDVPAVENVQPLSEATAALWQEHPEVTTTPLPDGWITVTSTLRGHSVSLAVPGNLTEDELTVIMDVLRVNAGLPLPRPEKVKKDKKAKKDKGWR